MNFNFLDAYTIRARLFPAVIAMAPALAFIAIFIPWKGFGLSHVIATLAIAVLFFVFADLSRRRGKRLEPRLEKKMGGRRSAVLLRYRDDTFDEKTKQRYVTYLGAALDETPPTKALEARNPKVAEAFYERCATWLREHTRDSKKFRILFDENVTYGFRRNLWGMKIPALVINIFIFGICVFLLWDRWPLDLQDSLTSKISVVFGIALIHSLYVLTTVNEDGVLEASKQYARQLIISTESFISSAPRKRKGSPKRKTAPRARASAKKKRVRKK